MVIASLRWRNRDKLMQILETKKISEFFKISTTPPLPQGSVIFWPVTLAAETTIFKANSWSCRILSTWIKFPNLQQANTFFFLILKKKKKSVPHLFLFQLVSKHLFLSMQKAQDQTTKPVNSPLVTYWHLPISCSLKEEKEGKSRKKNLSGKVKESRFEWNH